jgi:transposase
MRSVRKYTKEFKQEAVKLALQKSTITEAAKDLGVPVPTLHSWIYAMKGTLLDSPDTRSPSVDVSALLEENRRLHKENVVLKEEKEILKKAATYFAQHQK